jgi:hypothetical protein
MMADQEIGIQSAIGIHKTAEPAWKETMFPPGINRGRKRFIGKKYVKQVLHGF